MKIEDSWALMFVILQARVCRVDVSGGSVRRLKIEDAWALMSASLQTLNLQGVRVLLYEGIMVLGN